MRTKKALLVSRLFQLQDPVLVLKSKTSIVYPIMNITRKKGGKKIKPLTLATSSRSLLAGASTVKGVIVAEATALAAYQTKSIQNSDSTASFDLRVEIACFIVQLVRPAWVI